MKLYVCIAGLCLPWVCGATEGRGGGPQLGLSHMHYLKSCFAYERGDEAKGRDELRLAQLLDEESSYLRSALKRRQAKVSSLPALR